MFYPTLQKIYKATGTNTGSKQTLHYNSLANNKYNNHDRFEQEKTPERTIEIALDMSKASDTVHLQKLLQKITQTNMPNTVIRFLPNYILNRKRFTLYNNTKSKQTTIKTGVTQGDVLSPTLFNI